MELDFAFFFNSILLGVGLAMDAFSVSVASGLRQSDIPKRQIIGRSSVFGFFQFAMPMVGWVCVCLLYTSCPKRPPAPARNAAGDCKLWGVWHNPKASLRGERASGVALSACGPGVGLSLIHILSQSNHPFFSGLCDPFGLGKFCFRCEDGAVV